MKILLIGGTSSLAKALKRVLSNDNEVVTAGRKNCDIQLDLDGDIGSIIFPHDTDVLIHTAAHFGGNTYDEISGAENINVLGTLKSCEAAVKAGVRHFILISSIFARLDANCDKCSSYSLSKKHGEDMAVFFCSRNSLPLLILRPSQLYGSEDSFRVHQPFFYMMMDKAQSGQDIALYGSNDPYRNYLHIDDLTKIISAAIEKELVGTFDCVNMHDVTYSQIAAAAFAAFDKGGAVHFLRDKPDIPDNIFEKNSALYEKIGFYPSVAIEEGVLKLAKHRSSLK